MKKNRGRGAGGRKRLKRTFELLVSRVFHLKNYFFIYDVEKSENFFYVFVRARRIFFAVDSVKKKEK